MASAAAVDTMPDALRQSRYHMKRCFARYLINVDTSFLVLSQFATVFGMNCLEFFPMLAFEIFVEILKFYWNGKKADEAPAFTG